MNLPAIYMPAGAVLRGYYAGETRKWHRLPRYNADKRAGLIDQEFENVVGGLSRSAGTCMVMRGNHDVCRRDTRHGTSRSSSIPAVDYLP